MFIRPELVRRDARGVYPLLTCGHYAGPMHEASSAFDFPEDPLPCRVCRDDRVMDLRLIRLIYEERGSADSTS